MTYSPAIHYDREFYQNLQSSYASAYSNNLTALGSLGPGKIIEIDDPQRSIGGWSTGPYIRKKAPVVQHTDPAPWVSKHVPWWKKIFKRSI